VDAPVEAKKGKKKKYEDYEISNAVDTLKRAEEIRADDELMKLVSKEAKKQVKAIKSIADLKARRDELDEESNK